MKTTTKLLAILGIAGLAGFFNTTCPAVDAFPTKINPKDGAEMVFVPAGPFKMGMDPMPMDQEQHEQMNTPKHEVTLDGYWIYKYPVTVKQYKKYLEANKDRKPFQYFTGQMPEEPLWGWQDDHPMVNVTPYQAADYARWAGAALPTEAQWEKAARGTDERLYPWGNDWDPEACVHSCKVFCDAKGTRPVGSCPKNVSPYGAMDLAGNVWQICDDFFMQDWYSRAEATNPKGPPMTFILPNSKTEKNPQGVRGLVLGKVTRGGSWALCIPKVFQTVNRDFPLGIGSEWPAMDIGFRCVVTGDIPPNSAQTPPAKPPVVASAAPAKASAPAVAAQSVKPNPDRSGVETQYIYCGDYHNGNIYKMSTADGSYECFISRKEVPRGTSLGLEFDSHGNLYSTGGGTIVKIAPDKKVTVIATGLDNSTALTMDSNDNLYVCEYADGHNGRLFRIDAKTLSSGNLPIKMEHAKDASGKTDYTKYTITPEGAMKECPGDFNDKCAPYGLSYDKNGNVYFIRLGFPFYKYDPTGNRITMSKSGKSQTYWQRNAIMDANGDFYAFGHDIAKVTADGRVIARMTVGLNWHHSVAIVMDSKNNIYQGNPMPTFKPNANEAVMYKYTPDGQRSVLNDHFGGAPFFLAIWPRAKFPDDKPTK